MRKPRYQNEELMAALGIKTDEERQAYNNALIEKAHGFTDDELEGHYRCMWGLTTEKDDYKCRMGAKAYARREELLKTLPDRLIVTKAEKRRFLRNRKRSQRVKDRMLKDAWKAADNMTEQELEEQLYKDQMWFEEKFAEYEAGKTASEE